MLQHLTTAVFAQATATRNASPQRRGKPSGLPFEAKFTDIARPAGLSAPSVYGHIDTKRHILKAVGCGFAFLDYGESPGSDSRRRWYRGDAEPPFPS